MSSSASESSIILVDGNYVKSQLASPTVQIVDVRDEDFQGGNIKTAMNVPSELWAEEDTLSSLYNNLVENNKTEVVFHCMHSKQRARFCSKTFEDYLAKKSSEGDAASGAIEMYVLTYDIYNSYIHIF